MALGTAPCENLSRLIIEYMTDKSIRPADIVSVLVLIMCGWLPGAARPHYTLHSPDGETKLEISISDNIHCSIIRHDTEILTLADISLLPDFAANPDYTVNKATRSESDQWLHPVVRQKASAIRDHYNALTLRFPEGIGMEWKAFDDGIAYRWVIDREQGFRINEETCRFSFGGNTVIWYPHESGFYSANEQKFTEMPLAKLEEGSLASLPVLFDVNGCKVLVTESDLRDYAGMWLEKEEGTIIEAVYPYYPKTLEKKGDRDEYVKDREEYIAEYDGGTVAFPWRTVIIADEDKDLLANTLVYQLAEPSDGDYSWVRPGMAQWDWWHDLTLTGIDFKAGPNTRTYEYYIDFAAASGLEYVIFDEGWYCRDNILKTNPDVDVPSLIKYAERKGVGVILWCTWLRLDEQFLPALDRFAGWGVAGIKVDFMSRDDQPMVRFYTKVAEEAAKRHLLVDFHGCYKPTGLYRTYPNVITFEGVYGLEQSKGDAGKTIGPDHNLVLPFTRMVAGPMDYTPGAVRNAHKEDWHPSYCNPQGMGTRCHHLAMYAVFESPLQVMCDSPTNYLKEPECLDLLKGMPVTWEKTLPLDAETGEYVIIARKADAGTWYIAAMTDSKARKFEIPLDFLEEGKYVICAFEDGVNADKNANDFSCRHFYVEKGDIIPINMCKEGGYIARISKL